MLPGPLGRAGDAPPPPEGGTPSPQGKEGKPGRAAKIAGRRLKRSGGGEGGGIRDTRSYRVALAVETIPRQL